MRIAHLNTEKTFRGGEKQTFYLIKGLSEKNIENFLICNENNLLKEKLKNILPKENIVQIPFKGEFDISAILKVRKFLKDKNIDIIHCHTSHAHTIGFFASIFLPVKVIVSRRVDFSIYRKGIKFLSKIKYNYMCDKIIAISEKIREILINDGIEDDKIEVVHSGVAINEINITNNLRKELSIPENSIICLNVAALVPHKGQEFLIKSFAKVLKKYQNTFLLIAGDGKLKEKLKELAKELNIEKNVKFLGYRDDIPDLLNITDIFVMTSVEEGLCTSILDALSFNKIVVATNAGGIPEIIKNNETGILVEKCNIESIASGIIDAIENLDYFKEKFKNVREFVERHFSVTNMVNGNLSVYKKLLKKDEKL